MKLFLSRLQERCPVAAVKTVMTDDGTYVCIHAAAYIRLSLVQYFQTDNVGWSAAEHVFGRETKHLLCRWHVDK